MPSNPQETVETTPIAPLKPYSGNACVHSKKQIRQIATSIERFGFTNPVLISDENEIIAGHGRVKAANLLGLNTVPTLRLSHLDAAQRRAYVLADNKLALNAGWDRETLAIELQALVDLKFEVRRRAYGHPARVGETVLAFATWSAPSRLRPGRRNSQPGWHGSCYINSSLSDFLDRTDRALQCFADEIPQEKFLWGTKGRVTPRRPKRILRQKRTAVGQDDADDGFSNDAPANRTKLAGLDRAVALGRFHDHALLDRFGEDVSPKRAPSFECTAGYLINREPDVGRVARELADLNVLVLHGRQPHSTGIACPLGNRMRQPRRRFRAARLAGETAMEDGREPNGLTIDVSIRYAS